MRLLVPMQVVRELDKKKRDAKNIPVSATNPERIKIRALRTSRMLREIFTANVDGDYDKRGLPEPLVVTLYVSISDNKIVQLIILPNQLASMAGAPLFGGRLQTECNTGFKV